MIMTKITLLINKVSQKKYIRFVYLSFIASMILVKNPVFGEGKFKEITNGIKLIHSNLYNSSADIFNFLSAIGIDGIERYSTILLLDFVVIITFFLFQSTLIFRLLSIVKNKDKYQLLLLIPIAKAIADFIENIALLLIMNFPKSSTLLPIVQVSIFVKWIFFVLTILVLVALTFIVIYRKITMSKDRSKNNIDDLRA